MQVTSMSQKTRVIPVRFTQQQIIILQRLCAEGTLGTTIEEVATAILRKSLYDDQPGGEREA